MQNLTKNNIKKYIKDNYNILKHDPVCLLYASRQTAKQYKTKAKEVFLFMIEDKPITNIYTHNYGFNTKKGRAIKSYFKYQYDKRLGDYLPL